MSNTLSMYKLTGTGYERGWWTNFKGRYRVYVGARNTKKSYVMCGLEILDKILSDSRRNVLILRQTSASNKYSTFSTLCYLINQPDPTNPSISLNSLFKINQNNFTITYRPTGQVILFDGMLTPTKITSTRVVHGFLTDVYVEEAFELKDYDAWRKVDGTIRGDLPDGLFHQITFLLNAWNIGHWIYEQFFKTQIRKDAYGNEIVCGLEDDVNYLETHDYMDFRNEDVILDYGKGLYLHKSTYKINEFRDREIYDASMMELKRKAPEIYKVEALGMWGNTTGATYPEFSNDLVISSAAASKLNYACYTIGIDTGLSNGEGLVKYTDDARFKSATVMELSAVTQDYSKVVCLNEYFHSNESTLIKKTEPELEEEIIDTLIKWKQLYYDSPIIMKGKILVYVDCADIGFRQGLELVAKKKGLFNVSFLPSTKIRIQTRVDFIRLMMAWGDFLICDQCKNLLREIKNSKKGEKGEPREDFDDHSINANEYAWQPTINRVKRWKTFKER